jgi:molybdopterin adenylyltransferase
VGDVQVVEEMARTVVTLHLGEPREHLARERDRMAGCVGVARPGRGRAVPNRGRNRTYRLRTDPRLIRQQHHGEPRTLVAGHGPDAGRQRGGLALRVIRVGDDLRVGVLRPDGGGDGVTVVADHDHDPVHPGGMGRGHRVCHQGSASKGRELFGAAREPFTPSGREYERDDGAGRRGSTLAVRPTEDHHVPASPDDHAPEPYAAEPRVTDDRRRAVVVTASDGVASGHREDGSGDAVTAQLEGAGFTVIERVVVPDDRATIADRLRGLVDGGGVALVTITGGTGFGPRDVTPEATRDVIEREAPGLAEAMRASGRLSTPMADLSRGVCGVRGSTLLVDLPGSPRGATESLAAVLGLLPHAIDLLAGDTRKHPAGHGEHGAPAS